MTLSARLHQGCAGAHRAAINMSTSSNLEIALSSSRSSMCFFDRFHHRCTLQRS